MWGCRRRRWGGGGACGSLVWKGEATAVRPKKIYPQPAKPSQAKFTRPQERQQTHNPHRTVYGAAAKADANKDATTATRIGLVVETEKKRSGVSGVEMVRRATVQGTGTPPKKPRRTSGNSETLVAFSFGVESVDTLPGVSCRRWYVCAGLLRVLVMVCVVVP